MQKQEKWRVKKKSRETCKFVDYEAKKVKPRFKILCDLKCSF